MTDHANKDPTSGGTFRNVINSDRFHIMMSSSVQEQRACASYMSLRRTPETSTRGTDQIDHDLPRTDQIDHDLPRTDLGQIR